MPKKSKSKSKSKSKPNNHDGTSDSKPTIQTQVVDAKTADELIEELYQAEVLGRQNRNVVKSFEFQTMPSSRTKTVLQTARRKLKEEIVSSSCLSKFEPIEVSAYYSLSNVSLDGYCTLDSSHVKDIERVIQNIEAYACDPTLNRPRNVLMLASPGAGKSHFIKCLSRKMRGVRVESITYNMTSMERNDDLVHTIDAARNIKVKGNLPLIFLDEFDCDERNYATLLPLMWDGKVHLGHRDLELGKAIIVLAGSRASLPKAMDKARQMQILDIAGNATSAAAPTKIIDLISRINAGVIQIPSLEATEDGRDRRVDKVCVAINLARVRFGKQLCALPRALLHFIAQTKFRYGVRSIAHLIDEIPMQNRLPDSLTLEMLGLPLDSISDLKTSSLAYHVAHGDQGLGIVNFWEECCKNDSQVIFGEAEA